MAGRYKSLEKLYLRQNADDFQGTGKSQGRPQSSCSPPDTAAKHTLWAAVC